MNALAVADPHPAAAYLLAEDAHASDDALVRMWLHGRPTSTVNSYSANVARFRAFVAPKPLRHVTLGDLQNFADSIGGAPGTRSQVLASVKSLLSFCAKLGALPFNVGAALRAPKVPDGLAQRILSEAKVDRMLEASAGRDHALVRLAYGSGFRVSELVSITWRDIAPAHVGGAFVTVTGKGGKTRTVPISAKTWASVDALRGEADDGARVFPITRVQAWRIVKKVAKAAGLREHVSPHWMRHANATHAIERGCPVPVVRTNHGHSSIAVTDRYCHTRPGDGTSRYLPV